MLGLRNLYRVFHESRSAARKHASLAVVGSLPEAEKLVSLLGAEKDTQGAEILVTVTSSRNGGAEVSLSGEAVENALEGIFLSAITEGAILREFAPRVAGLAEHFVQISQTHPDLSSLWFPLHARDQIDYCPF